MMFGDASMLEGGPCDLGVRTLDTPWSSDCPGRRSRVAMLYPAILTRLAELEPAELVAQQRAADTETAPSLGAAGAGARRSQRA